MTVPPSFWPIWLNKGGDSQVSRFGQKIPKIVKVLGLSQAQISKFFGLRPAFPLQFSLYSSLALKSYTHLSRTAVFFKPIDFTT